MRRALMTVAAVTTIGIALVMIGASQRVSGHCQVPCGVFDDEARLKGMLEDTTTIAKAIDQITELSKGHTALDINQAVRWIDTKDYHSSQIIETASVYFLLQRVKPVEPGADGYREYLQKLAAHHAVMVAAMKTKQMVDPETAKALQAAINNMAKYYHSD